MKKQDIKVTKGANDTNTNTIATVNDTTANEETSNAYVSQVVVDATFDDSFAKSINSMRDCTSYHTARVEFLGGNKIKVYLAFGRIICKGKIVAPDDAWDFAGLFMKESEFKAGRTTLNN